MNIIFVCTGNTCRSAMAQYLFMDMLNKSNREDVQVYSCGIYVDSGEMATYNAIEAMKEYNIDMQNHRATSINEIDIEKMDLILCATVSHKQMVLNMYPDLSGKVYTIKEYSNIGKEGQDMDIFDPWGCDEETYVKCAHELKECLDKILQKI